MAGGEEINGPGGCLIGQVVLQGLVFRLVNYIAGLLCSSSTELKTQPAAAGSSLRLSHI